MGEVSPKVIDKFTSAIDVDVETRTDMELERIERKFSGTPVAVRVKALRTGLVLAERFAEALEAIYPGDRKTWECSREDWKYVSSMRGEASAFLDSLDSKNDSSFPTDQKWGK